MDIGTLATPVSLAALSVVLAVAAPFSGHAQASRAAAPSFDAAAPATALREARTWGYQLQGVRPEQLATVPYDVLVIDYSQDGTASEQFETNEIEALKHKPDGSRRVVLAYLSIGEAEDYRFYWDDRWADNPPDWLLPENPEWPGNYPVRYWDRDWQGIIFGSPESYLDRIIDAGFDGIYLDRVDAYDEVGDAPDRARRLSHMVAFVTSLARHARNRRPGFLVVAQNGEELLRDPAYLATIDGLGKEDLLFGLDGDGTRNARSELRASLDLIARVGAAGKPVFLVEYLSRPADIAKTRSEAEAMSMILFVGDRALDRPLSR